jgi:hypothetical protein
MGKEVNPTEYSVNLREAMESFISDFREEFKNQATKQNKTSERRMRILLRQFGERVYKPYKLASLEKDGMTGIDEVVE